MGFTSSIQLTLLILTIVNSHAHEGDIPGTVDLSAAEGDDTAYGQALYPVPAEDPNDPLQVRELQAGVSMLDASRQY